MRRALPLLLAVLAGAMAGIVVDRTVMRTAAPSPPARTGVSAVRAPRPAAGTRRGERMARELGLDSVQLRRVDSILAWQQQATESVLREIPPRVAAVRATADSALRATLTSAQWDSLVARRARRRERDST